MNFHPNTGHTRTLHPCSELDLTPFSSALNDTAEDATDQSQDVEISVSSSGKDLIRFEALEKAAATHESFVSTLSYANRLWTSKQFTLIPPSCFEQPIDNKENESQNLDGEDDIDNKGGFNVENDDDDGNIEHADLEGKSLACDPETENCDDNDDTRSMASVSLFHKSLPVITSTPSRKMTMQKAPADLFREDVRESLSPSNLVRKLFPFADRTKCDLGRVDPSSSPAEKVVPERAVQDKPVVERPDTERSVAALSSTTLRDARMNTARLIHVGDGVIIRELQDKLTQLKIEIAKFKVENGKLTKGRLECDAAMKQLTKDRDRFNQESDTRLQQIDEIHRAEMKKIEMEKKILYKHVSLQKQDDSRRLLDTNKDLSTEVETLREELKKAEGRHQGMVVRLRERIKSLEAENDRLKDKADALAEDKQELIREVVRLSKRNSGAAFPTEERLVQSPSWATDSSPRQNPPVPNQDSKSSSPTNTADPFSLSNNACPSPNNNSMRTALNPPEKMSPPKSVHFDPEAVQQLSFNEESFANEKIEAGGTIEQTFKNGRKVRKYKNGTTKEISRDGKCSTTTYFNGDVRQVLPNKEVYFYACNQTVHTVYPGGTQIFEFANGQTEKHLADGTKEFHYPNLMIRTVHPNGDERCKYPDGSTEQWDVATKTRTLSFANGEEEIHTENWKKRTFPDGAQKFVYPDGRTETRYATGRIRIKDPTGKLIFDTAAQTAGVPGTFPSTDQRQSGYFPASGSATDS